jgi:hypothetical protein
VDNDISRPSVAMQEGSGRAARNELAEASFILGLVAAIAMVVPFASFASPLAGVAAIGLGVAALPRTSQAGGAGKAIAGISLGSVAVVASLVILFLLRHVLWRLFVESGAW